MDNNNELKKYYGNERTEEVRDMIQRMPRKFGYIITLIVLFIFSMLVFFGWVIRYPDIVRGQIIINATVSPIKLIANSSGRIRLNGLTSQSSVETGDVVAYIESPTSYEAIKKITKILNNYDPSNVNNTAILSGLPAKVPLGELTPYYYTFMASLHQLEIFNTSRLYDKQIASLNNLLAEQIRQSGNNRDKLELSVQSMNFTHKFYQRDSLLHQEKVSAEIEVDRSKLEYLASKRNHSVALSDVIESDKAEKQTASRITELEIQKAEKIKELELDLLTTYNALKNNISIWEEKYLFKAPFKGKIQFLRFWTDNQFIQAGEQVFTVVPDTHMPYGQVSLPAMGAGKVKATQEVIIKLDDFPYLEYGSVNGVVEDVSLTTNTEKTQQGNIETYLVTVKFDKGLKTNYGKEIAFKQESKGIAEIVTNDRKLIDRFFDNLRYVLEQ